MFKSEFVELLAQLLSVVAVVLIRGIERADYYLGFDHGQNLSPSLVVLGEQPDPKPNTPTKVHGW